MLKRGNFMNIINKVSDINVTKGRTDKKMLIGYQM